MQKWILLVLGPGLAAGIATVAAISLQPGEHAPPAPVAPTESNIGPLSVVYPRSTEKPTPPPDPPLPPAPPKETLSELPVQDVEPRTVHAAPGAESGAVPHITIRDRQGHPLAHPAAPAPPPSYVPSVGPAPNYAASSPPPASYRPSVPAPSDAARPAQQAALPPASYKPSVPAPSEAARPAQQAALPPAPSSLSGPARATGTVSLAVDGHTVRLYGVLPPASTDRCALGTGAAQDCADVTQTLLAARLARSASVTCQLPPGAAAAEPARTCRDASGVDIAGYLVGEGLAVADPHAGGGYAGAESTARSAGKGLWHYR